MPCASLLSCVGGGGSEPPSGGPEDRPFIRRARRELAVLLYWRGPPPSPLAQQTLARALRNRAREVYQVPVEAHRAGHPYEGLTPGRLAQLARAGIDDALVVEAALARPDGPFRGRAQVVALATQAVLHDLNIGPPPGGTTVHERAKRFADSVLVAVSRRWIAPGEAPEMDPLLAANRLYERKACAHAVLLYDLALSDSVPLRADLISRHTEALERRRRCRQKLAIQQRRLEDAKARFGLELRGERLQARVIEAFRASLPASGLETALKTRTSKPARVDLSPGYIRLTLRHHPRRAGQARLMQNQSITPAIDFRPLWPVLEALVALREEATGTLSRDMAALMRSRGFGIRLEHFPDGFLAFEFAEVAGRPVIAGQLRLELNERRVTLRARSSSELREGLFVLGPMEDAVNRPTEDALVLVFFGEE